MLVAWNAQGTQNICTRQRFAIVAQGLLNWSYTARSYIYPRLRCSRSSWDLSSTAGRGCLWFSRRWMGRVLVIVGAHVPGSNAMKMSAHRWLLDDDHLRRVFAVHVNRWLCFASFPTVFRITPQIILCLLRESNETGNSGIEGGGWGRETRSISIYLYANDPWGLPCY